MASVLAASSDEYLKPSSASYRGRIEGVTELQGEADIDGESFKISYIFVDDKLIEVSLKAIYSEANRSQSNRQSDWNPFRTFRSIDVLLDKKYGRGDLTCIRDGNFVSQDNVRGLLEASKWADDKPLSASKECVRKAARHIIEVNAMTFRGFGSFSLNYHAVSPERRVFEERLQAARDRDSQEEKAKKESTLRGL